MRSCLEPCWIFFWIRKESPSGYFTVWGYTASFPDRSLLHIMLGLSTGLVSGFSPCFFCKCMWDSSFGILNVRESSKGTWWLTCTTGPGWHKNCSWVQQDGNPSPWQKSHCIRLTIMWPRLPAAVFYDSVLGKVFVFLFLNLVIKINFFKRKSLTAKEHIHQVLTKEWKPI